MSQTRASRSKQLELSRSDLDWNDEKTKSSTIKFNFRAIPSFFKKKLLESSTSPNDDHFIRAQDSYSSDNSKSEEECCQA